MSKDHKIDEQYAAASWDKMSALLDREMPVEKKRKRALFFLLPLFALVLLGLGILYVLDTKVDKPEMANTIVTPANTESITKNSKSILAEESKEDKQTTEISIPKETTTAAQQIAIQETTATGIESPQTQTLTTSRTDDTKLVARTENPKPQLRLKPTTNLESDEAESMVVRNTPKPIVDLVKPVVQKVLPQAITHNDSSAEIKVTKNKSKVLDRTLEATAIANPSKEATVFNEKVLLENIAAAAPQLEVLKEVPVKDINAIKGTLCGPGKSYFIKNKLALKASAIYAFNNGFAGAQARIQYNHAVSNHWYLTTGIGYTSWFKKVSTSEEDALLPSEMITNNAEEVPIFTQRQMDVHASLGLTYEINKWSLSSGLRYRRFFRVDYNFSEEAIMDTAGIGANADDEFLTKLNNRITDDTKHLWNAYLGLDYRLNRNLGIGVETEFSKKRIDINGIEKRPIYLSGAIYYQF